MGKKSVLCVSGGLDSYGLYQYMLNSFSMGPDEIELVHFHTDSPYALKEKEIVKALYPTNVNFINITGWPLSNIDKENYTVPLRNVVFASLAASFGTDIYIAGIDEENHKYMLDKNSEFFANLSRVLSQGNSKPIRIISPFFELHWGKVEILKYLINLGLLDEANSTTSCWDTDMHRCGNCLVCYKRALAERFVTLVIGTKFPDFAQNPFKSKIGLENIMFFNNRYFMARFNEYGDYGPKSDHYTEKRMFRDYFTLTDVLAMVLAEGKT